MVSFFGLKFGDKKKKSEGKTATQGNNNKQQQQQQQQQHQWKRIDQNALGEGQFFGTNINQKTVVNGSIRSVSRANTAMSVRSPYTHDTHNLAAVSMFDLSHVSHSRNGSYSSMNLKDLKAYASDAGLRTRFGANNGSSLSLALPGPGFGSRPGTPNGKGKPWVNPLDVHFARSSPSVPPAQKSPLAHIEVQSIAPSDKEGGDAGSVFGEDADEMVDAMMASAKKKEEEEKAAKEKELQKEKELEKQKETARLEMERLERQKSTETMSPTKQEFPQRRPEQGHQRRQSPPEGQQQRRQSPPEGPQQRRQSPPEGAQQHRPQDRRQQPQQHQHQHQHHQPQERPQQQNPNQQRPNPHPQPQQRPLNGNPNGPGPGPVFRGNFEQRPGSRGGMRPGPGPGPSEQAGPGPAIGPAPNGPPRQFPHPNAAYQGPPRHAPPTQSLPHPPLNGGSRNYHQNGPQPQPGPRSDSRNNRPGPNGPNGPPGPHPGARPGPGPGSGPGPHARPIGSGPQSNRVFSPTPGSPGFRGPAASESRSQSPAPGGAVFRGPAANEPRPQSPSHGGAVFRGPAANEPRPQSPAHGGPVFRGPAANEPRPQSPAHGGPGNRPPGGPGPSLQTSAKTGPGPRGPFGPGLPLRRAETAPLSPTSTDMSDEPIEQFARPIIQNVAAKRDTLQLLTPRRHSLSMKIEELEKTLIQEQIGNHEKDLRRPVSTGSSNYSISEKSDDSSISDNDEPILPATSIQPAPLRTVLPTTNPANAPPAASTPSPTTETGRWLPNNINNSTARGPIMRGPPPRRPTLDEYGVVPRKISNSSRPPTRTASAAGSSTAGRPSESDESFVLQRIPSTASTAHSRANTPQLRQEPPVLEETESPVMPATAAAETNTSSGLSPPPAPILPNLSGFHFDFETTKNAAPPTPDSTTWPLADPALAPTSTSKPQDLASPPPSAALNRPNVPPPLNFDFSPDAFSRSPTGPSGPWTPPLRSLGGSNPNLRLNDQERPSTAGGFSSSLSHSHSLAPAPNFTRSRTPVEGVDINSTSSAAAALGIGVARGLSIREPASKRVGDHGSPLPRVPPGTGMKTTTMTIPERSEEGGPGTPVDAFGTGFI